MGTHVSFIFRGYNPYIGGSKPSFFMVLGSMVNCWFGIRIGVHLSSNPFHKGILGIQTTNPNHQLTIKLKIDSLNKNNFGDMEPKPEMLHTSHFGHLGVFGYLPGQLCIVHCYHRSPEMPRSNIAIGWD